MPPGGTGIYAYLRKTPGIGRKELAGPLQGKDPKSDWRGLVNRAIGLIVADRYHLS
jgi:hypothetical protein